MTTAITLFWSFRSPYSYVALPRVARLAEEFGVELEMRIVHPAAIRNPGYFRNLNKLARPLVRPHHGVSRRAFLWARPGRNPALAIGRAAEMKAVALLRRDGRVLKLILAGAKAEYF